MWYNTGDNILNIFLWSPCCLCSKKIMNKKLSFNFTKNKRLYKSKKEIFWREKFFLAILILLKCPTSPQVIWLRHFIKHWHPSSLNVSFESEYKAHELLHGIRAGSLKDDSLFFPMLNMCLAKNCHTWGSMLKCLTSPRTIWPGHFKRH
jgi:hypothetical protein